MSRNTHIAHVEARKMLFSVGSKFYHFESDGRHYAQWPENKKYDSRYVNPTIKLGGGRLVLLREVSRIGVEVWAWELKVCFLLQLIQKNRINKTKSQ